MAVLFMLLSLRSRLTNHDFAQILLMYAFDQTDLHEQKHRVHNSFVSVWIVQLNYAIMGTSPVCKSLRLPFLCEEILMSVIGTLALRPCSLCISGWRDVLWRFHGHARWVYFWDEFRQCMKSNSSPATCVTPWLMHHFVLWLTWGSRWYWTA